MNRWLTYFLVFFVMVLWGLNVVMLKLLVTSFPPVTMTALRIFVAGFVVLLVLLLLKTFRQLTATEWKYVILAAIFGVLGHHFFLSIGLTMTSASNAVLILALLPLTTSLLAILLLGDMLTRWRGFGIFLGLTGVCTIVLFGEGGLAGIRTGDGVIFLAMMIQALSFVYIKKATDTLDAKQVTGMMLLIGSLLLFVTSLIIEPNGLASMGDKALWIWWVFAISAVFATGLGHIIYNQAIHQLGTGETAIFNNLVPFFGLLFSALFLGEVIALAQIAGLLFIVAGVILGTGHVDAWMQKRKRRFDQVG
ncbi:DMT family transporter [Halalkalibacterium halodurans]|uniref:DMT family transporter n=1 Tax=Halalkalibacterium halodurans TaxID=86665 RepID=UPI0010673C10|nr:DMT family transporter [Halalkalibacterium halodurans]TES50153.1 DMT family transporter [Halalkalibacterium halodurans]